MRRVSRKIKRRSAVVLIFAVIIIAGAMIFISLRQEKLYTVTVLPMLGGKAMQPCAINDNGQIAGIARTPDGKIHMFLWDRVNGMKDLGPTNRDDLDINNAGQIAGTTQDPNGNTVAFLWDPNDGKHIIDILSGQKIYAWDLNNRGQVLGYVYSDGRINAFIWDKANGMRRIEQLVYMPRAINDTGQIIVSVGPPGPGSQRWNSVDATERLTLPSSYDYPGGIGFNNGGYVLGRMVRWDKLSSWMYLWGKDTGRKWLFELNQPAGPQYLNDANQVLYGEKQYSAFRRFISKIAPPSTQYYLWDPQRGRIPLNGYVKSGTGKLKGIEGLNNKGCIIGYIHSKSGVYQQAVLFEPIPEQWEK